MRMAFRRIAAWAIDCACILGWVGVTAAVGVPLYRAGVVRTRNLLALNLIGALVVVIPVVVGAAILESRMSGVTPGKRALGVVVQTVEGGPASLPTALTRNALKTGVPWLIGHGAVFALATHSRSSPVPAGLWVLTAAAYVLPIVYTGSLFAGGGHTPYDRMTGTRVISREPTIRR